MTVKPPPQSPEPPFSVRHPFLIGIDGVTKVTFVRHAQQAYPRAEAFVHDDWVDPPLSHLGQVQAHAVAAALGEQDVDVVVCSTMLRARQTADMVAAPHGLVPIVVHDLREVDSYRDLAPGAKPAEIVDPQLWQERQDLFRLHRKWDLMFFGEPSAEFHARVRREIDAVLAAHEGQHVVFVSHGGVINSFFAELLGLDEDLFFLPNHASISTALVKGPIRRMQSINEHQHLHAGLVSN